MNFPRESGILLHPTMLPGPYGLGEIGPAARDFVEQLGAMGQHLWQVLPLGPTSYGDSPYQSPSTFAGNHLLISFDQLVKDGLLDPAQLKRLPEFNPDRVDFGYVIPHRMKILEAACDGFGRRASAAMKKRFERFCKTEAAWLNDYALFMAIKDSYGGRPWVEWEPALASRGEKALKDAAKKFAGAIRNVKIMQFLFAEQWTALRAFARKHHVKIVGDIPIFVAHDSADVWANPGLFHLYPDGKPSVVAGVPPDYFSATGQLWGNPLYQWERHRETGYAWWIERIRKALQLVDYLRIDHFRGFEAYWEIPANEKTAINGHWVPGPAGDLFQALEKALGKMPIIAEDLGVITPGVEKLRDDFHFPGMRILQFAFGNDPKAEDYRPESYPKNCVVYTGTHDNDTTVGWFWSNAGEGSTRTQQEIDAERAQILHTLKTDGREIHWDLISMALHSNANTAVFPIQDLLGLGSEARFNVPGRESGNWQWRMRSGALSEQGMARLRDISERSGRSHGPVASTTKSKTKVSVSGAARKRSAATKKSAKPRSKSAKKVRSGKGY